MYQILITRHISTNQKEKKIAKKAKKCDSKLDELCIKNEKLKSKKCDSKPDKQCADLDEICSNIFEFALPNKTVCGDRSVRIVTKGNAVLPGNNSRKLLLPYTYFLNENGTKYISVGYSTTSVSPVVFLCEIGQIFVQITPNEWNTLYTYRYNVTNFIKGTGDSQQLDLSDATFMQ